MISKSRQSIVMYSDHQLHTLLLINMNFANLKRYKAVAVFFFYLFFCVLLIVERERDRVLVREGQRERETQNPKQEFQALSPQHRGQHRA